MDALKTRDDAAAQAAAAVWATATARRDDVEATDVAVAEARPLMAAVLERSERSFLLVQYDADESIVAFAAIEPLDGAEDARRGEVRYLGVAPDHWGGGWARRLLVDVPDACREAGFDDVVLWVYADNIRAIWVYEAMGWSATGETRVHPRTGRTESEYRLKLT